MKVKVSACAIFTPPPPPLSSPTDNKPCSPPPHATSHYRRRVTLRSCYYFLFSTQHISSYQIKMSNQGGGFSPPEITWLILTQVIVIYWSCKNSLHLSAWILTWCKKPGEWNHFLILFLPKQFSCMKTSVFISICQQKSCSFYWKLIEFSI